MKYPDISTWLRVRGHWPSLAGPQHISAYGINKLLEGMRMPSYPELGYQVFVLYECLTKSHFSLILLCQWLKANSTLVQFIQN